jgi:uncharacterized phage infection (PIP) family protein YhgE
MYTRIESSDDALHVSNHYSPLIRTLSALFAVFTATSAVSVMIAAWTNLALMPLAVFMLFICAALCFGAFGRDVVTIHRRERTIAVEKSITQKITYKRTYHIRD